MAYTYENVTPSLIPNTTMQKRLLNGVHKSYLIAANDGYVLHDKANDYPEFDENMEIIGQHLGYAAGTVTCGANYDFSPVTVTDENGVEHTAYGSREFFARPESEVPADQIFGGGNNDHEVM
jgi:hypothetical protein